MQITEYYIPPKLPVCQIYINQQPTDFITRITTVQVQSISMMMSSNTLEGSQAL